MATERPFSGIIASPSRDGLLAEQIVNRGVKDFDEARFVFENASIETLQRLNGNSRIMRSYILFAHFPHP